MENFVVSGNAFSGDIALGNNFTGGVGSTLQVRAADLDGGEWKYVYDVLVVAANLEGFRVRLDSSIGIDYYVDLDETLQVPGTKVTFTYDSLISTYRTQEVSFDAENTRMENNKQYFIFTCRINAAEMNMPISATLTNDSKKLNVTFKTFTVRDYAMVLINNDPNDETSNLAKALLSYGYYAQEKFNPDSDKHPEDALPLSDLSGDPRSVSTPSGVTYGGSSVVFLDGTRIRHYFTVTGSSAEFYVGNEKRTPVKSGSEIYVTTDIINILDTTAPIYVTIKCDGEETSFQYSVHDYVYAVLKSNTTSDAMKNLVRAFYDYYQAACAYVD
jgi:hypothetical protein